MKETLVQYLFTLQDINYKKFYSRLCPGINNIIGVRVPILRKYAKQLLREYNMEFLIHNIGNDYYEEIMLQGMIIGLYNDSNIEIILKYIKSFVPKIDNWAICDVFCSGLKITNKNKVMMWDFLQQYIVSDKEFEIRFAIVMILDYYIEEKYLQKVFDILDNIKHNGYYVKMAIAWAVSICIVKYYDNTLRYLQNCKLDNFTYNKSIQKAIESYRISDEQKNILRKMKKF